MRSIPAGIDSLVTHTETLQPDTANKEVYKKLFTLYRQMFDAMGTTSWKGNCQNVMKELSAIRNGTS